MDPNFGMEQAMHALYWAWLLAAVCLFVVVIQLIDRSKRP